MWLKNINLRSIYSFDESGTPELSNFSRLNLFIGKNGSGKSNVMRAICNLDVILTYNEDVGMYSFYLDNSVNNWHIPHHRKLDPAILLQFDNEVIEFKNWIHIRGDFKGYSGSYISQEYSIHDFKEKLHRITENHNAHIPLLSFVLTYIYQIDFSFSGGEISEYFTIRDGNSKGTVGKRVFKYENWSSGFFSVSNLFLQLLYADKRIICIDEPEIHLEPRVLRRVFDIIIWLLMKERTPQDKELLEACELIENQWIEWFNNSTWQESVELKTHESLNFLSRRQLFISSHSSTLINEFIKYPELCKIYEFNRSLQDTSYVADFVKHSREVIQQSVISSIRQIGAYPHSILDNLGAQGSDILQANGIIWVEGPSDIIYIRKWLEMFATEKKLPKLKQGVNYEFQMYGGALLDSICLMNTGNSEESELKKLVSMFSFSRNAFVITDSDAVKKDNGVIFDQSKFKEAKDFILSEFQKLSNLNYSLGLWYKKNNVEIRTLEDYIDEHSIRQFKSQNKSGLTKKIYAQFVTNSWNETISLKNFKHSLIDEIEILYNTILKWNQ
ncbi:AAA domain-containing protein, putative AbiEii toxin, Type IV TA system [Flexibacter flexilis DSM 6793]|uniref:AAA domain-containing protein, putative AbiEii toxin, Type IV TA system n=1 Tax=Flexibacter flexilis DSM 6793 TaxID=927664 RepID=A0A1I1DIV4_9BACT|nr:AAA family ATPase [Flexibacter flexilis]SFB74875.1 AAA domain-containing protein, putative AbiEii toxin, Type IV TA system [Flexibacter flexilis DSM 6793]